MIRQLSIMTNMIDLAEYTNRDLEGVFWVPGSKSSKFRGHLNFSDSGINIRTSECLHKGSDHRSNELRLLSVLYGEIMELGKVTFFDTFLGLWYSAPTISEEGSHEKWDVECETFLVGEHFGDKDAIEFNRVIFYIGGLYEWTDRIGGFPSFDTAYTPPPVPKFELGATDKLLSIWPLLAESMTKKHRSNELKMVASAALVLSKKNESLLSGELESLIEDIYSLRDLFSLLIGHKVGIEDIRLHDPDRGLEYQYFIKGTIAKKERQRQRMFVKFREMKEDEFAEVLKRWVRFKEDNGYILGEFLNTQSRRDTAANFLSYSRFVEAFHRNMCTQKPFNQSMVKSINEEVGKLISKYEERIQKRYLEQMIQVNSYTLEERLEFLLDEFLSNDVRKSLGVTLDFATRVKKMRNELTHLGKKVSRWHSQDLLDVSKELKIVAYVIIFKSIGLTDELLLGKLRGKWRYLLA